ncbi:benzoate-CoA ligase family protein [Cupriavidus cauae]|uniref:benzoate-CoA ligase family protein n=1 Tax=Cupriavidus cauae TaxID=2608999 RepID=UPI0022434840|nr:benzoate-CoA ligase family protein [Cupriavidus cauae]
MAAATTTTATTITATAPGSDPPPVVAPTTPFNFAQHLLEGNAHRGDKTAYIDDHGRLRYGELAERVRRFATALQALGVRREERVLLLMHDCSDWPVCFLGAIYAGIVPVAVNTLLTPDDYAYMLQHSRARAALVSAALLPVLEQAMAKAMGEGGHEVDHVIVSRPEGANGDGSTFPAGMVSLDALIADHAPQPAAAATGPDDPGFWLYSSGSTGRPKGVLHSQANPYWTAELYAKPILGLNEDDVCFSAAKLYFAYGLGNGLTFPLSVGATVVLMAERPTPEAIFRRWLDHRTTVFFGAPTGYAGMLASPALPAREQVALRLCSSAGEALPAELGQRFTAHFGCEIIDGIGSTEMLHIYLSNRPGQVRYGTTGWPVPGYNIELRDEEGRPVPDGEVGDLYIQGPSAALMYWGNRDKSRETFQGSWTKSGDKYVRNADGTYCYAGRSDDMLKVSGIYVSPFEVEATLMQHPAVLEAAVIGVNDPQGLTRTKAFVVLKRGTQCDDAELKAFVKERLAPYKYPRLIEFVDSLPKTATGKIQRFRLREQEQQQQRQQPMDCGRDVASNVLISPSGQLALAGLQ